VKKLYISVLLIFILSVIAFIGSFVYLDKENHKSYYYTINLDGHDIGTVTIDRFVTEDKLVYKSVSKIPFAELFTESKSRMDLDKDYVLDSYTKEMVGNGVTELLYIEKVKNAASFLARFDSEFAYLENIPIKRAVFIFEKESPLTYLPLLKNYDFQKGRSQGFNVLVCSSPSSLPPMKKSISLTSIKDEYLKIESRKIKTENLLLKMKNYPQVCIWVAKSDRSLIKIEIPEEGLRITRSFSPRELEAKEFVLDSGDYISKNITFAGKKVLLSGTLTIPKREGKSPAVLLVWGDGPQNRQYQGFFECIADYLSRNGFCVLRFDKRGVGASGGDASSHTNSDEIKDVSAALDYLAGQPEVDLKNIAIISHSEGALYALNAATDKDIVRALIIMAPSIYLGPGDEHIEALTRLAALYKWSEDYLKLAIKCRQETEYKVKNSKHNWAYILWKLCFVKKMKDELAENPMDIVKQTKIPVFILQGKEDEDSVMEYASTLDKALEDSGNSSRVLTYYGYLGRFFGKKINDGIHRIHYEADKEVLENMKNWLNNNLVKAAPPSQQTVEAPAQMNSTPFAIKGSENTR